MDDLTSIMISQIRDIEQRDEQQIMAELAGDTVAEYIYETFITVKGERKRKVRLSWVGVREVARSRGNILMDEPTITEDEESWRIVVKATDIKRNFSVYGGCHQPKVMKINQMGQGGEIIGTKHEPDEFSFQKGLSKAQRNALDKCIPSNYAALSIDRFLKSLGRPGILKTAEKKAISQKASTAAPTEKRVTQSNIKPRETWDKVTAAMVADYPALEPIIWDLCKLQPAGMYKELGVSSRNDMTIPAYEAFLTLKERFVPVDSPKSEETGEEASKES